MTTSTVNSKEVLSAQDKSNLSRETIMQWYKTKKHEKLTLLRDEIISLSSEKREELKAQIIENTKRELAQQKKELTPAQRLEKAKEFADTLFRFALTKQDLSELAKKYESQSKEVGAEKLYNAWLESKEFSPVNESPRYLAMIQLNKSLIRKEAFLLLGLIEKYWDKEEAMKVYKSCWNQETFSLQPMWKFFSKDKAASILGFYYGSREIRIYKGGPLVDPLFSKKNIFHQVFPSKSYSTFTITGWWTVDEDEEENNDIKGDSYAPIKYLGTAKKKLQGGGYGDEYSGSQFLYQSIDHIKNEYRTSKDSGMSQEYEKKMLDDIAGLQREIDSATAAKTRDAIFDWFKKQPKNEWISPSQEMVDLLTIMYGEGVGSYMYRYVPEDKKIYILPLKGVNVNEKYFGGYIEIKNEKLGSWTGHGSEKTKAMMIEYISSMDEKDVNKELTDSRLKSESGEVVEGSAKLHRTAGMVAGLEGVPVNVEHSNLERGYLEIVEKKIKAELIAKKIPEGKAAELASLRVKSIRDAINNLVENDELIKGAIEADEKVKLEITIDSKDEVKVVLADIDVKKKLLKDREDAEEAETNLESVEGGTYKKLEEKVEKIFGPAAPFVMWFLEKTFKIKDSIKKFVSGTGGPFMGAILGALGIKSAKETIGSRKMTQEKFDKLIRQDRKSVDMKNKMIFEEDVKLKGLQVTIPEGNGIVLERSMPIHLKGQGKFTAGPEENKKRGSAGALLSMIGGAKYQYKDSEIIIENGTTIPKGTIIPKGAKIKRIN